MAAAGPEAAGSTRSTALCRRTPARRRRPPRRRLGNATERRAGLTGDGARVPLRRYRKFRSAIGTQYSEYEYTMDAAIASGRLNPTDATTIAMHHKIYNMLILTFKDEDD
eukprot:1349899-Prymnesium_polylepis.1